MAIERRTTLDKIEIDRDGSVGVRLTLELFEGDTTISSQYHRTLIPTDLDYSLQMGEVNSHLQRMGWPPVSDDSIQRIGAFHSLAGEKVNG